jgi:hypothetical protein
MGGDTHLAGRVVRGRSCTTGSTSATASTPTTLQRDTAAWPFVDSSTRYADPVEAARGFVVTHLGFTAPVVAPFSHGDSRSGEVVVKPDATGPETTVLVRMLAPDDTWWVLGAATPNIKVDSPASLALITSSVTLSGQSIALEATGPVPGS